jgi:hypothetical protein
MCAIKNPLWDEYVGCWVRFGTALWCVSRWGAVRNVSDGSRSEVLDS